MGAEFTFFDFLDENGDNVNHQWLEGIPKGAKQKFNKWFRHLEATPPGQWKRPLVDTLDGSCTGLFEVRVQRGHQQFRILGSHTEDQTPTLLHCFIKPDAKVAAAECNQAFLKQAKVDADTRKHRVVHDYR